MNQRQKISREQIEKYKHTVEQQSKKYLDTRVNFLIKQLSENFQKNVIIPIETIDSVQRSKLPQRCTKHSTTFSLYCQIDRKPLCVSCLYHQNKHKKHKVVPLNRVWPHLEQDSKCFNNKIQTNIQDLKKTLDSCKNSLKKLQKDKPQLLFQIKNFYRQFRQLIEKKQEEQTRLIRQYFDKCKYQHAKLSLQTNKILVFISQKTQQVTKKTNEQTALMRRNILQILSKTQKYIPKSIINFESDFKILEIRKFQQALDIVFRKLTLAIPQQFPKLHLSRSLHLQKHKGYSELEKNNKNVRFTTPPPRFNDHETDIYQQKVVKPNKSEQKLKKNSLKQQKQINIK